MAAQFVVLANRVRAQVALAADAKLRQYTRSPSATGTDLRVRLAAGRLGASRCCGVLVVVDARRIFSVARAILDERGVSLPGCRSLSDVPVGRVAEKTRGSRLGSVDDSCLLVRRDNNGCGAVP